ncbi:MAG: LysE family translocator [Pseudomonadales bacterium]|nr:LysE family translocator [Pseudomonadales bacterium]
MDLTLLTMFIVTFTSILILPGPNAAFSVAQSLKYGPLNSIFIPLGFMAATGVHAVFVLSGLGIAIQKTTYILVILKWTGVLYLLFLAYKSFTSKPSSHELLFQSISKFKMFKSALFVSLTNPKALLASFMVYPLFIKQDQSFLPQAAILTASAMGISFTVYGLYGVIASVFKDKVTSTGAVHKLVSGLYIGAAGVLATK